MLSFEQHCHTNRLLLYFKILGKNINKSVLVNNENSVSKKFYNKLINQIRNEITTIVKSQNLIDIRTPSFLNAKLKISKKNSIVELNKRIEQVDKSHRSTGEGAKTHI